MTIKYLISNAKIPSGKEKNIQIKKRADTHTGTNPFI